MPKPKPEPESERPAPAVPLRNFRASDELWDAALAKARRRGETLSDVLRWALREYIKGE